MNVVTVAEVNKSFLCGDVKRGLESGKNEVFRASLNSVSQRLASPWKWFAGKVGNLSAKSQSRGPQALAVYYSSIIASNHLIPGSEYVIQLHNAVRLGVDLVLT